MLPLFFNNLLDYFFDIKILCFPPILFYSLFNQSKHVNDFYSTLFSFYAESFAYPCRLLLQKQVTWIVGFLFSFYLAIYLVIPFYHHFPCKVIANINSPTILSHSHLRCWRAYMLPFKLRWFPEDVDVAIHLGNRVNSLS